MKNRHSGFTILAAFAVALLFGTGQMFAGSLRNAVATSTSSQMQSYGQTTHPQRQTEKKPQAFMGKIVMKNSKCVLKIGKYDYKLTDQAQATRFNGERVLVTGFYNVHSGTIRVSQIKPAHSR